MNEFTHSPTAAIIDRPLPTWQLVLTLAWPVLAQQVLILSVTLFDAYLAGHVEPPSGTHRLAFQAAQTTAHYLTWTISSYTVLVGAGSTALVARFVGAGDRATALQVTNQSVLLAVILGLLGSGVGLSVVQPLLDLLQLQGDAAFLAANYLQPVFGLLTFQVIEAAGIACLVGAGDTRTGLWVMGSVAVLNMPLAWGLFHGWGPLPKLGFVGIALGTSLSNLLGGLAILIILARGRAGLQLQLRELWPNWGLIGRLLRVSVPAGIDSLSGTVGQLWFLSIINRLGDTASTAHGIALRWEALGFLLGGAFGTAAMTLVGQNLGAGRPKQAAHSGWVAFALACGTMCLMGGIFFAFAPQMFALFCSDPEQQPAIDVGVPVLRLVAFAMPALACCIIFAFALRGAGDTRVPVLFTWIGFLGVRIPLAYLFTRPHWEGGILESWLGSDPRLFGAWLAMFADLTVRGGFFLVRFRGGRWQQVRV